MAKNDPTLAPSSGHVFEPIEPIYGALINLLPSELNSESVLRSSFWEPEIVFLHFSPVETRFR